MNNKQFVQLKREHLVSDVDIDIVSPDSIVRLGTPNGFFRNAWLKLRVNPVFFIAAFLIFVILTISIFPGLWTHSDPLACDLSHSREPSSFEHIFGYDIQGCDIYPRIIYGTRASVLVGVLTACFVLFFGGILGVLAGYFGGVIDTIISRFIDIFFAIPMLLGAIVVLQMFKSNETVFKVVFVIGLFSWTSVARIARGATLEAKNKEYMVASKALGASKFALIFKHIIPNIFAPVISTVMVSLGTYIVSEATLSFLGIGLPPTIVSWGGDISTAQPSLNSHPMILFWPSLFLAVTVFSFILLGDVVYDAFNPKSKK